MTTIAYRGGILAADSQVSCGGARITHTRKIMRLPNGALVGACGNMATCSTLMRALDKNGGEITDELLHACKGAWALYVKPDGTVWMLEGGKNGGHTQVIGPFFAEGSGCVAALAAMHAGASAPDAIRIAAKLDAATALPVVTEALKKPRKKTGRKK